MNNNIDDNIEVLDTTNTDSNLSNQTSDVLNAPSSNDEPLVFSGFSNSSNPVENTSTINVSSIQNNEPIEPVRHINFNQTGTSSIQPEHPVSFIGDSIKKDKPKEKFKFVINGQTIMYVVIALLCYFIVAPFIVKLFAERIANASIYAAIVNRAGITLKVGMGLYIDIILFVFFSAAPLLTLLICILNLITGNYLFEKSKSIIPACLLLSCLYAIVASVLLINMNIDIVTITYKTTSINGLQYFIFNK